MQQQGEKEPKKRPEAGQGGQADGEAAEAPQEREPMSKSRSRAKVSRKQDHCSADVKMNCLR